MWQCIKYIFIILVSVGLTLLVENRDDMYSRPDSPPRLHRPIFGDGHPTRENVEKYQKQILEYINYLEEYFVSIGLYYDGIKELPILLHRNDRCRIYRYTFKQIPIPDQPINENDVDSVIIIGKLAENLIQLRGRVKEHNTYMEELREYYNPCFVNSITGDPPNNVGGEGDDDHESNN